jgi:hypothetical protein
LVPGITRVAPLDFYDYPISHSLLADVGWAAVVAAIYFGVRRYVRGAWIMGALALSHWFLDALVHRPDLPLGPGSTRMIGFGVWNSHAATILVEFSLFLVGLAIYVRTAKTEAGGVRASFWAGIAVLILLAAGNMLAGPPPSARVIAWVGVAQLSFVAWAFWADRRRVLQPALYQSDHRN